jgi:GTP cyclohydrolase IA
MEFRVPGNIHEAIRMILIYLGEDPDREGLKETPNRVIGAYAELFSGYHQKPENVLKTFEDGACDEMVLLKAIPFVSFCEHHLLPFSGKAHIGYIPDGKIVGISKLARLLEVFSRRLQVQERLTAQVTKSLDDFLKPKGSACILEATHSCMTCRGVNKQNCIMMTSSLTGVFRDHDVRSEFFHLIKG